VKKPPFITTSMALGVAVRLHSLRRGTRDELAARLYLAAQQCIADYQWKTRRRAP
jgi:hypothetical protein